MPSACEKRWCVSVCLSVHWRRGCFFSFFLKMYNFAILMSRLSAGVIQNNTFFFHWSLFIQPSSFQNQGFINVKFQNSISLSILITSAIFVGLLCAWNAFDGNVSLSDLRLNEIMSSKVNQSIVIVEMLCDFQLLTCCGLENKKSRKEPWFSCTKCTVRENKRTLFCIYWLNNRIVVTVLMYIFLLCFYICL